MTGILSYLFIIRFGDKWLAMKTGEHKEEDSLELEFSKATLVGRNPDHFF